jgi:hypothetical protein
VAAARRLSDTSWTNWTTDELLRTQCTPPGSFTPLIFDGAHTVRSNLGGEGGRCVNTTYVHGPSYAWTAFCDEEQPAMNVPETADNLGNMHVMVRNLGFTSEGEEIRLLIRNESECTRAPAEREDRKNERKSRSVTHAHAVAGRVRGL